MSVVDLEHNFVIKCVLKKQWKQKAICKELLQVYGANADDKNPVKFWTYEIKSGRKETSRPSSGKENRT
jgi:hypothetical protein